jgi:pimeloyl-ACP methyl ester carboxylesterase
VSRPPETRRPTVAPDVSLSALVWPGGDRTPFVLVHGLSSNACTWQAVATILHRAGHPVATVDLRGHGRSDKPDQGYDFATLTSDLLVAMEKLGLARPVVAGQSTGGNLAVELAWRAPERVRAVAGVDGGAIELQRRWSSWEDCLAHLAPPRLDGLSVEDFREILRGAHPDWDEAALTATLANVEVLGDGTIRPWLTRERHLRILRTLWEHRPSTLIPGLQVPLLLVNALNQDGFSSSRRQEAALAGAAGPHVSVEWLAGDHDLHLHRPRDVARLLAGLAAAAGTAAAPP